MFSDVIVDLLTPSKQPRNEVSVSISLYYTPKDRGRFFLGNLECYLSSLQVYLLLNLFPKIS